MNIFVLDKDPLIAAQYHCDKHVVKMILEIFQQMGSAVIRHGAEPWEMPLTSKGTPLKGGYHNHPCTRWVGESRANFNWTAMHGIGLCIEYANRYGKVHSCERGIHHLAQMAEMIPDGSLTPFAQAMPNEYKCIDPVRAYRTYYINDKKAFAKWDKLNNTPHWWK